MSSNVNFQSPENLRPKTFLPKEKLQHLNAIAHEGKVVVVATADDGKLWYTVKQDGFEDSYLNQPETDRKGWEDWQELEFPQELDDASVMKQETEELTYTENNASAVQQDPEAETNQDEESLTHFILRSRYRTQRESAIAPVQLVSGLGHLYIFRQSKQNTLLMDRFVLDGMTNQLTRKLEVRFKRSRQKYQPSESMSLKLKQAESGKAATQLANIDSLDYRDADRDPFFEPTTELTLIKHLYDGWFSIVLLPTTENNKCRWHIFAYNSETQKVELTSIRSSDDGRFDVKDDLVLKPKSDEDETLVPHSIPGVIRRTLNLEIEDSKIKDSKIEDVTVTNGLTATKYDIQRERAIQAKDERGRQKTALLRESTRVMLAIPTNRGVAAVSFAAAADGTLSELPQLEDPEVETGPDVLRSNQREMLLPLNLLENIKALGGKPKALPGSVAKLQLGTAEAGAADLVTVAFEGKETATLADGDRVKIENTVDFDGVYPVEALDEDTFAIAIDPPESQNSNRQKQSEEPKALNLGQWEKVEGNGGPSIFEGAITAYEGTTDGKLKVTALNHGLNSDDRVRIGGTKSYNGTYPIRKLNDTQFAIEQPWALAETVNVTTGAEQRRGVMFNGQDGGIDCGPDIDLVRHNFTVEFWAKLGHIRRVLECVISQSEKKKYALLVSFWVGQFCVDFGGKQFRSQQRYEDNDWHHWACTYDREQGTPSLYRDGQEIELHAREWNPETAPTQTKGTLYLGCRFKQNKCFSGHLADVRLWNQARSRKQLQDGMYQRLTGKDVGLVGDWRLGGILEGKERQVIDFSVNRNYGTVSGGAYVGAVKLPRNWFTRLYPVSYRDFDGKNDYIQLPAMDTQYSKGFTVEAWVRYRKLAPLLCIISFDTGANNSIWFGNTWTPRNGLGLRVKTSGTYQRLDIPDVLETDQWMHLSATVDASGNAVLYKNGKPIYTDSVDLPTEALERNYIGAHAKSARYGQFDGQIAEVRVWNTARTQQEIRANMLPGKLQGNESSLVGYWKLGAVTEGQARQVIDRSNSNYHGTVKGSPAVGNGKLPEEFGHGEPAIAYTNNELFAVTQRAVYIEQFEFNIEVYEGEDLDPRNVDSSGNKIFELTYWGKASRNAEKTIQIDPGTDNPTTFEALDDGWWRASRRFVVPDGVALLRSFEISKVRGQWNALEIRKHRIRMVSDTVTQATYSDSVTLKPLSLGEKDESWEQKWLDFTQKEQEEGAFLKQRVEIDAEIQTVLAWQRNKRSLEAAIRAWNTAITQQTATIKTLKNQRKEARKKLDAEINERFNYWCTLIVKDTPGGICELRLGGNKPDLVYNKSGVSGEINARQLFKFEKVSDDFYRIICKHEQKILAVYDYDSDYESGIGHGKVVGTSETEKPPELDEAGRKWKLHEEGNYNAIENVGVLHRQGNKSGYHYTFNRDDSGKHKNSIIVYPDHSMAYANALWRIDKTEHPCNNKIQAAEEQVKQYRELFERAKARREKLEKQLGTLNGRIQKLQQPLPDLSELEKKRNHIDEQLKSIQAELKSVNGDLFKDETSNQDETSSKDETSNKDETDAVLLPLQPASRLSALETCEGNVQLSYFDGEGCMRQTCYDATSDSSNTTVEQWIPDVLLRTCLNFNDSDSRMELSLFNSGGKKRKDRAIGLGDRWTIEAWFSYPLTEPQPSQDSARIESKLPRARVLVSSSDDRQQIGIYNNQKFGIYVDGLFYGCDYDSIENLSPGWHHLAVVGKQQSATTTRFCFYLNGQSIGETQVKTVLDSIDTIGNLGRSKQDLSHPSPLPETARSFNGGDNYAEFPHPLPSLADAVTIEFWAQGEGDSPGCVFGAYGDQMQPIFIICLPSQDDTIIWSAGNPGATLNPSASDRIAKTVDFQEAPGQWTHWAFVKNAATETMAIYRNGELWHQGRNKAQTMAGITQFALAAADGGEGGKRMFYRGALCEFRIWNRDRTPAEIQGAMYRALAGDELKQDKSGLVAYYPLMGDPASLIESSGSENRPDDPDSGKILDYSDQGHHGEFHGQPRTVFFNPIGAQIVEDGGENQFGKLAEVRIWEIALSDDELAVNSKTLLSGNEPGLLAYYPMSEVQGNQVKDRSGNGRDGTTYNADQWGCTAPIGRLETRTVLQLDGQSNYLDCGDNIQLAGRSFTIEFWAKRNSLQVYSGIVYQGRNAANQALGIGFRENGRFHMAFWGNAIDTQEPYEDRNWHHWACTYDHTTYSQKIYCDGHLVKQRTATAHTSAEGTFFIGQFRVRNDRRLFNGRLAEFRIWTKVRTGEEIRADMYDRLTGREAGLEAYWPLNQIGPDRQVTDLANKRKDQPKHHGTFQPETTPLFHVLVQDSLPRRAVVSAEYSTVALDPETGLKQAMMRRCFAIPTADPTADLPSQGASLLSNKRIESLELKWVGNAQFAPTLLGYIEGAPPVPSENLTVQIDYNKATSVELTTSEDMEFSWNRSQDSGSGSSTDLFLGLDTTAYAGFVGYKKIAEARAGAKGGLDLNYQFTNQSTIRSRSSLNITNRLELHGTPEQTPKFPHLGQRFIPKNVGYALVISSLADVFITKLARSGKMVGYQILPVEDIPPDVNTITFLMNPTYVMQGSLDGLTGSNATSQRFFKHVPDMRAQYGSLYPASYYRLQEAYDLKQQIEQEDKRRESYFAQFNVRGDTLSFSLDDLSSSSFGFGIQSSFDREIERGENASNISVNREADKPDTTMTEEDRKALEREKLAQLQQEREASADQQSAAVKRRQAAISARIADREKRAHAASSFAAWQKKMENIQIRAGKRNIANTYVWDADGGLHAESQSFANTIEHTIGGSFTLDARLGGEGRLGVFGAKVELTALATANLTQTANKTQSRTKGMDLRVDLWGVESAGITDHNDYPLLPGEKVDRYRFMSFYLEGNTNHFHDFFNYVVDPEWLQSNDEEARALRQVMGGRANKTWRVMHRVTYVERPALMGFSRDLRQRQDIDPATQSILNYFDQLEAKQNELKAMLQEILLNQKLQF